jgi:cystathionine beta-lyase
MSNFEQLIDRRSSHSTKWDKYAGRDILPFWIADMDFAVPDFILDALRERLEHPIIGYTKPPASITEAFQGWLQHHFQWSIPEEWIVWLPGVVPGMNMAARCLQAHQQLMIPTPVYYPFLEMAENAKLSDVRVPLILDQGCWRMDMQQMQAQVGQVKMVMIANPQNPTGRAYTRAELEALAEFIDRNDLILVSDEIHCNIVLAEDREHLPIAQLVPDIAKRTISLFAATKTYNIPGLGCAAAVIPDANLRAAFQTQEAGLVPGIGPLNLIASEAAFNDRSNWLDELLNTLRANQQKLRNLVGARMTEVEATYLAWINIADLGLNNVEAHFESHGLGISDGAQFGHPDYIRFNFACPDALLTQGLARLNSALAK